MYMHEIELLGIHGQMGCNKKRGVKGYNGDVDKTLTLIGFDLVG